MLELYIEKYSKEKMQSYINMCDYFNKPLSFAVELKNYNILLSKELYSLLRTFELVLKNSMNKEISKKYENNWLLVFKWPMPTKKETKSKSNKHKDQVAKAIQKFQNRNEVAPTTNYQIISELTFSFWTNLLNDIYEQTLYRPCLSKISKKFRFSKQRSRSILIKLLRLRNRISHGEIIIRKYKDLLQNYKDLIAFIDDFGANDLIIENRFMEFYNEMRQKIKNPKVDSR